MSSEAPAMTVRSHERRPTTVRTYQRRRPEWPPAARERLAEKIAALWLDPAYRSDMCARMRAGHARKRARLSGGATR